jgi:hypothetical protein
MADMQRAAKKSTERLRAKPESRNGGAVGMDDTLRSRHN